MSAAYETRLRRVLAYIHDNPAGDLSLDTLADVTVSLAPRFSRHDRGNLCGCGAAHSCAPCGVFIVADRPKHRGHRQGDWV